jgi:predicted CXXCH cytochrome family protein
MRHKLWVMCTTLAATALLGGCVDERIVYQERPLFDQPAAAAANFVGYSNPTTKLTVCGNCHIGQQTRWRETAHANTFETLANSPARQAFCEGCHTANATGNAAAEGGGWLGAPHDRYKDVQCESCHGAGLEHAQNPRRSNWLLAPLAVGTTQNKVGCAQCHSGDHHPFIQEWQRSRHGRIPAAAVGNVAANAVGNRPECKECHTGEDALAIKFGVDANYTEKSAMQAAGQHMPITCAVCHDPHDKKYDGQLRKSITTPVIEDNLCMKCHYKRGVPDPTTFRGPHSPEGPMLMGTGGNWFPSMGTDTIIATHGSSRNPRLCAGCHVNKFEIRDKLTNQFVFASTGHTFEATPCVDASGIPTGATNCTDQQRTYKTCAGSGCHINETDARLDQFRVEQRLLLLTDQLDVLLTRVQSNWKACRGSGTCPGEFHGSDGRWTVAEGAAFNYEMARAPTGARANEIRFGAAVHNPALMEVLLLASIREVQRQYNLTLATGLSLERTIGVGQ